VQREEARCSHCGADSKSGRWRRHRSTHHRLCCACGKWAYRHAGQLPVLSNQQLERRDRQSQAIKLGWQTRKGAPLPQRQCFQCGSHSPGFCRLDHWRRHPVTGQEWLCDSCGKRASYVIQTQHRKVPKPAG
jgi:hypothetical protein